MKRAIAILLLAACVGCSNAGKPAAKPKLVKVTVYCGASESRVFIASHAPFGYGNGIFWFDDARTGLRIRVMGTVIAEEIEQ